MVLGEQGQFRSSETQMVPTNIRSRQVMSTLELSRLIAHLEKSILKFTPKFRILAMVLAAWPECTVGLSD